MERTTAVAEFPSVEEIKIKMRMTCGFRKLLKWLVIYNAMIDPRPEEDIARQLGLSVATVQQIVKEYNMLGAGSIESNGRGRKAGQKA
jgi:predicted transcriptional regulator